MKYTFPVLNKPRISERMQLFMFIRVCFWSAETFSSTLTSENEHSGMGGIAMLTLSDTENNLHFILVLQGLIKHKEKGEAGGRGIWNLVLEFPQLLQS